MKIITTREMRADAKTFFELAEKERVAVKRGRKYVNLVVTSEPDSQFVSEEWIKEFMSIPMEHRCNPFEISPSGDLYFADKRNVEKLNKSIEASKAGKITRVNTKKELGDLLNSL
jgi:hypothetical protein